MISSESAAEKQQPIYSGRAITCKKQTKTLKYLQGDKYHICKYITFNDQQTMKQVRNFLILRERGEPISMNKPQALSTHIRIDAPFIDCANIIEHQNLPQLIRNLIAKLILASNMNLYSLENIIYNPYSGLVYVNNMSVVGIMAIWKQKQLQFEELRQIFELLSEEVFDEHTFKNKFSYKLKFRAIGIVILKHISQKDVSLLKALFKYKMPEKITFSQARQLCKKLPQIFRQLLSNPDIRKKILDAQKRDSLSYGAFLQLVFLGPKDIKLRDRADLNWQKVISLLITRSPISKEASQDQWIKDLETLFIECYSCLNKQTKKQLKALGLSRENWQILFKLSIGEHALDLDLQSYFKQANCARLNRQIINTTIRAIASRKIWISKTLTNFFNLITKDSYSNDNSLQSIAFISKSSNVAQKQGKHNNVQEVSVENNSGEDYETQSVGVWLDQSNSGLKLSKSDERNSSKSEPISSKGSSQLFTSELSSQSDYSLQGQMKFLERGITEEQIKVLRNMAYKLRAMEIQVQNSTIRALHPKMKILNKYLRVMF